MGRKVTAKEKAELERTIRTREEAEFPQYDIAITIGDETDADGKIPVNVNRTQRLVGDSLELWPKRR